MTQKKKKRRRRVQPRFYVIISIFVLLLLMLIGLIIWTAVSCVQERREEQERHNQFLIEEERLQAEYNAQVQENPEGYVDVVRPTISYEEFVNGATLPPVPTPIPTPTPTPRPTPYMVADSNPEKYGFVPHLQVGGRFENGAYSGGEEVMANSYQRTEPIEFPSADKYNAETVKGILTFRGNNWRNMSSTDTVNLTEYKLSQVWDKAISSLTKGGGSGSWSGCGWTDQPLIVQWPAETRKIMNLREWAKQKENLVEVIYPTEDGNIYFLDLETGEETRDKIVLNVPFKGTGSIDPRGYPLLYCGSGDQYEDESQKSRAFIISLINGNVLYTFGKQGTDPFARRKWYAYDSAPLVDAKTDTLIYPAENGIVYTMKLNTVYDPELGSISVNPSDIVKFRYDCNNIYDDIDIADSGHKWQGYEGSAVAWNGYLYLSSNDGMFQCIDLNTMHVVWIANTEDDTNGSPVLDVISDEEAYLYVGTSLHFNKDKNNKGIAPFFKIDAMTGEIKGHYGLEVFTVSGVSGGIQATAVVGRQGSNIENLVIVPIARYGNKDAGILVALDKETMTIHDGIGWEFEMDAYAWSSPAVIYDAENRGYIIQADSKGYIFLIDAKTGKQCGALRPTDTTFEASPALFGNMLVVGCRGGQKIFGIRIN
ncbi:MAG: pyrrolo-quinoline quinone [Clostridia bacterium]|nr:pyrrolo-quinoline quinone [Clostridia bacterium]